MAKMSIVNDTVNVAICGYPRWGEIQALGEGTGKSWLCSRLVQPSHDDFSRNTLSSRDAHCSKVSPTAFCSEIVNGDHFLYHGRRTVTTESPTAHIKVDVNVIEHTTLVGKDLAPYPSKLGYVERAAAKRFTTAMKQTTKRRYINGVQVAETSPAKGSTGKDEVPTLPSSGAVNVHLLLYDATLQRSGASGVQWRLLLKIVEKLKAAGQFMIVLTKGDELEPHEIELARSDISTLLEEAKCKGSSKVPVMVVSAKDNVGIARLLQYVIHLGKVKLRQIPSAIAYDVALKHQRATEERAIVDMKNFLRRLQPTCERAMYEHFKRYESKVRQVIEIRGDDFAWATYKKCLSPNRDLPPVPLTTQESPRRWQRSMSLDAILTHRSQNPVYEKVLPASRVSSPKKVRTPSSGHGDVFDETSELQYQPSRSAGFSPGRRLFTSMSRPNSFDTAHTPSPIPENESHASLTQSCEAPFSRSANLTLPRNFHTDGTQVTGMPHTHSQNDVTSPAFTRTQTLTRHSLRRSYAFSESRQYATGDRTRSEASALHSSPGPEVHAARSYSSLPTTPSSPLQFQPRSKSGTLPKRLPSDRESSIYLLPADSWPTVPVPDRTNAGSIGEDHSHKMASSGSPLLLPSPSQETQPHKLPQTPPPLPVSPPSSPISQSSPSPVLEQGRDSPMHDTFGQAAAVPMGKRSLSLPRRRQRSQIGFDSHIDPASPIDSTKDFPFASTEFTEKSDDASNTLSSQMESLLCLGKPTALPLPGSNDKTLDDNPYVNLVRKSNIHAC